MSNVKKGKFSRLGNMTSYDSLVAMASGSDTSSAQFEPKFAGEKFKTPVEIELANLHTFPNHPFRVVDDEAMQELSDSIKNRGLMHPIVVRKDPAGGYQIISGHRRKMACEKAGHKKILAHIVELSDDEAVMLMADANFYQRAFLFPSEKARAYRMKSDAIKRHGGIKGKYSIEEIGEGTSDSAATIKRFIRLSYLTDKLLFLIDEKKLGMEQGVQISYLSEELQMVIEKLIFEDAVKITGLQAKELHALYESGILNEEKIKEVLSEETEKKQKYSINKKIIGKYFPDPVTNEELNEIIEEALEEYFRKRR